MTMNCVVYIFSFIILVSYYYSCWGTLNSHNGTGTIVHLYSHYTGSSVERHIRDLMRVVKGYDHVVIGVVNMDSLSPSDVSLLHIHGATISGFVQWSVLEQARRFRDFKVPIYVTVHDYQWLYGSDLIPTLEVLEHLTPSLENISKTKELFELALRVIFPSTYLRDYYSSHLSIGKSQKDLTRYLVIPPDDPPLLNDVLYVPRIFDKTINIAFFGSISRDYGADLYAEFIQNLSRYSIGNTNYTLRYHFFGRIGPLDRDSLFNEYTVAQRHFVYHPISIENNLTGSLLASNIHMIAHLSLSPQTYNYALIRRINMGYPLLYLNRGVLRDQLDYIRFPKYTPIDDFSAAEDSLKKGLSFVVENSGTNILHRKHNLVERLEKSNSWYRDQYVFLLKQNSVVL